ncbi:MAG: hypothetical protein M9938_07725 [Solirubrobacterales bacterium]|nr:hypothetical protein [Solirubrobacterales bacterium]
MAPSNPKSPRLLAPSMLLAGLLAFSSLSGCGTGSEPAAPAPPAGGKENARPTGVNEAHTEHQGKPERGHNPASAGDKRDHAPDDVISDRPGGPKPPGSGQ